MLIKSIVDFENFFRKEFYKSKLNMRQLSDLSGMSQCKIDHWLDKIGPEVKFLDVLKMSKSLGFCITVEKIGEASIPTVWAGDFEARTASTSTTVSSVTDLLDSLGAVEVDDVDRGDKILKVLKKAKKSSKKGK